MKTYTGINIQWPISTLILEEKKTIETRTYPIPQRLLNQDLLLIETPGKKGQFKARVVAIINFSNCFEYKNKKEFYSDSDKHFVTPNSEWAWGEKKKWGWEIGKLIKLKRPYELKKPKGIIFTNEIKLKSNAF